MQTSVNETRLTMKALLETVEEAAQQRSEQVSDNRSEARRPLHVDSSLCYFTKNGETKKIHQVFARNITFLGLSLIGPLPPEIVPGRPIEATVKPLKRSPTFLAGLVVFRRAVADGCYEIGISVKAAGSAPVIVNDITGAMKKYDWFSDALRVEV